MWSSWIKLGIKEAVDTRKKQESCSACPTYINGQEISSDGPRSKGGCQTSFYKSRQIWFNWQREKTQADFIRCHRGGKSALSDTNIEWHGPRHWNEDNMLIQNLEYDLTNFGYLVPFKERNTSLICQIIQYQWFKNDNMNFNKTLVFSHIENRSILISWSQVLILWSQMSNRDWNYWEINVKKLVFL